jgi:hypothetical protein
MSQEPVPPSNLIPPLYPLEAFSRPHGAPLPDTDPSTTLGDAQGNDGDYPASSLQGPAGPTGVSGNDLPETLVQDLLAPPHNDSWGDDGFVPPASVTCPDGPTRVSGNDLIEVLLRDPFVPKGDDQGGDDGYLLQGPGGPTRVSGNDLMDAPWPGAPPHPEGNPAGDPEFAACLRRADPLQLHYVPHSPAAVALVQALTAEVAAEEARINPRRRGKVGAERLRRAVGGVVAGVLRLWGRSTPVPGYRRRQTKLFTGEAVSKRQFEAATAALRSLHLIEMIKGIIKPPIDWGEGVLSWQGDATRYWPTAHFLEVATQHGVTAATVKADFSPQPSTTAPEVPPVPVEVWTLKARRLGRSASESPVGKPLPLTDLGPVADRLVAEVQKYNAFASTQPVEGCVPPRWMRKFTACTELHGRWYALGGTGGVYQLMSKADRLGLAINGEAVAEIDIKASHLSIMHGLLGRELPDGDPYEVAGLPRDIVKAWIVASLGTGRAITSWPRKRLADATPAEQEWLRSVNVNAVKADICAKYPFMEAPARAVAVSAGLTGLAHLGTPERLLSLRLQAIEAQALTDVMMLIGRVYGDTQGALALPVNDSLIVPRSAVREAVTIIKEAFAYHAKVEVRVTVNPRPDW